MGDVAERRSRSQVVFERFDALRRTLSQRLNATIGKVLNIAGDLMPGRRSLGKKAVTHALNVATDEEPSCDHLRKPPNKCRAMSAALENATTSAERQIKGTHAFFSIRQGHRQSHSLSVRPTGITRGLAIIGLVDPNRAAVLSRMRPFQIESTSPINCQRPVYFSTGAIVFDRRRRVGNTQIYVQAAPFAFRDSIGFATTRAVG